MPRLSKKIAGIKKYHAELRAIMETNGCTRKQAIAIRNGETIAKTVVPVANGSGFAKIPNDLVTEANQQCVLLEQRKSVLSQELNEVEEFLQKFQKIASSLDE